LLGFDKIEPAVRIRLRAGGLGRVELERHQEKLTRRRA
jgi:hypothetical protein